MPAADALRTSAAVLLHAGSDDDPLIYLVERASTLRFFGGYWALPGGVADPVDRRDDAPADLALRRCAHRELFEETGVLVGAQLADLTAARRGLLSEPPEHGAYLTASPDLSAFAHLCRLRTPPFSPRRYDTTFFEAHLPERCEPAVWPGELTAGRFVRPKEALTAWHRGEMRIVPPVLLLIELLHEHGRRRLSEAAAASAAELAAGALHPSRFSPGITVAPLSTATIPPATTTNCLVVGSRSLYVVDPAPTDPEEHSRLFQLLDSRVARGQEVAGILCTHHHPDHIGAVVATSRRYSAPVHAHALTLKRLPAGFAWGRALGEGDVVRLGDAPDGQPGWALEVFHTPGHDRGHLCFRDNRYRALVAGDMVSTLSTILIDPPEGHMRTYMRSLERLSLMDIGTLYPSHGIPTQRGGELLRGTLAHRARRQAKVEDALTARPAALDQLVRAVYDDVDPRMWPYAERSLLAGLQALQEDGVALESGGFWRRR